MASVKTPSSSYPFRFFTPRTCKESSIPPVTNCTYLHLPSFLTFGLGSFCLPCSVSDPSALSLLHITFACFVLPTQEVFPFSHFISLLLFFNSYTEVVLSLHFLLEVYLYLSFSLFPLLVLWTCCGGRFLWSFAWLWCIYPFEFAAL